MLIADGNWSYYQVSVKDGQPYSHEVRIKKPYKAIGTYLLIGGELFNVAWPWIRSNPDAGVSSADRDGFKFAVLPKDGDLSYAGAYTKSF